MEIPNFSKNSTSEYKATHISAFSFGNAGDTLLPITLEDLFNQQIGVKKWFSADVHKLVTSKDIRFYNRDDFVVIGGGGLFLKDTCPNNNSGWQWNCSIENMNKIKSPLIAFAIGYNRFRGQEDFNPVFTKHINAFVEKAQFVGLRNNGSIEKIKSYLKTDSLKNKLVYQPCMTTLISKIYPTFTDYSHKNDFIAFNCAFDRQQMRCLDETILESIVKVALKLSKQTKIKYFSHMPSDKIILSYFDKYAIPYELIEFKSIESIIENYSRPKLVIGMRGHAQMIPFGCNTPILSIISHDKMQWFLDDIHHPEWGVDILDESFEDKLLTKSIESYREYKTRIQDTIVEQEKLWKITLSNLQKIKTLIK